MPLNEKILQIAMSEINGQVPTVLFKAESTVLSVLSMIHDGFKGRYSQALRIDLVPVLVDYDTLRK